jgi:Micrococcal nuclease (thermonuclease) homologs
MRSVSQVVYGDTLQLDSGETVRMIGVWAPKAREKVGKDGQVKRPDPVMQAWQDRAADFTRGLVAGRQVWLQQDPAHPSNAQGETLAYVFFKISPAEGTQNLGGGGQRVLLTPGSYMINRMLVNYGFADTSSDFSFPYRAEFEQLESEARVDRKGLWMDGVNPF